MPYAGVNTHDSTRTRERGIPSPGSHKREPGPANQNPPRDRHDRDTCLGNLLGLIDGLLVLLEFCGAGSCYGHAYDDENVVGEDGGPFQFLVEWLDAIVSAAGFSTDLVFGWV
jgi:hypothetical protein